MFHFSVSRISALSIVAYLFPYQLVGACAVHILTMAIIVQLFDRPLFCNHHIIASMAFSLTLGGVYLFTYIPVKELKTTRFRYVTYYTICFIENIACAVIWYMYCDLYEPEMRSMVYYIGFLIISTVPFVVGIFFMILYYLYFHPTVRKGVNDVIEQKMDQIELND